MVGETRTGPHRDNEKVDRAGDRGEEVSRRRIDVASFGVTNGPTNEALKLGRYCRLQVIHGRLNLQYCPNRQHADLLLSYALGFFRRLTILPL